MSDKSGIDTQDLSGSDLQASQAGGGSGIAGGNRNAEQSGQGALGGQQQGGGAGASDFSQAGGSSGTGGYGNAENERHHQGQQGGGYDGLADYGGQGSSTGSSDQDQSRGQRFDEAQGGGRGAADLADGSDSPRDRNEAASHETRRQP